MNEENQNEEVEKTEENTNRGNSDEIIELKKEIERHKNELNEQSDRYKRIYAKIQNACVGYPGRGKRSKML